MYAIIDIETTGGKFNDEAITEIAIYKFDGEKIVDQFISLVNPEKKIQPFVEKLTGINSKMLINAPKFFEIAKRIIEITEDCIIVAHNINFDYRILNIEFSRLGFKFNKATLCTVELSKSLIPKLPSYKLGKLVKSLGIPIKNRHRAFGDAKATVLLFKLLLDKDTSKKIISQKIIDVNENKVKTKFIDLIDQTKPKTGVYYLHNSSGRVIYIGKSLNMRKRVRQHLLGNDKKSLKLQLETKSVSCEETGSELIALLKEMNEIKKLSPKHNKKHKNQNLKFGIEQGIKSNGYKYLRISHYHDEVNYIYTFKNINNARKFLLNKSLEYNLCLNYMGIEPDKYECSNYKLNKCLGACIKNENQKSFNERMNNFIKKSHFNSPNLLLIDKGRRNDEKSIILIIDFKLYGYGFADLNYQIRNIETIKNIITKVNHSNYANNLVKQFIRKNRLAQIINLDDKT